MPNNHRANATLGLWVLTLFASSCDRGTLAHPTINSAPKQLVKIFPTIDRVPEGADLSTTRQAMIARYESSVIDCSVVRPLKGGSVVFPVFDVPLQGNSVDGFLLWKDLVKQDHCNWHLTTVIYKLSHGNTQFSVPISSKLDEDVAVYQCVWNTQITSSRLLGGCGGGPYFPDGADTTVVIRFRKGGT